MTTRPTISWSDLAGAKVGVWGIGVEGHASLRRLAVLGAAAVLVDDAPPEGRPDGAAVLPTAAGGLEALAACEAVVKTPGISRYRPDVQALRSGGVDVVGGLGLWLQEADTGRVVLVTGTKGKSTTTAVVGHLLTGLGHRVVIGGNLGLPPYDIGVPDDPDFWVVEVSSYQATDLARTPPVTGVTALHPDHLTWHGDVATYYADKLSACSQHGADLTVANGDDPRLREHAGLLGPHVRWVTPREGTPPAWVAALELPGLHNVRNALIAEGCLRGLGIDADEGRLAEAAAGFEGLPSRLRAVVRVGGVDFVDDSLATNVLPTIAALDAYPGRAVALLAGGHDRGIDYTPLAAHIHARPDPTLVVTLPANGPRIAQALRACAPPLPGGLPPRPAGEGGGAAVPLVSLPDPLDPAGGSGKDPAASPSGGMPDPRDPAEGSGKDRTGRGVGLRPEPPGVAAAASLEEAVAIAYAWARPRTGVVLLSPAAASFGRYRDYRERGNAFKAAAERLRGGP